MDLPHKYKEMFAAMAVVVGRPPVLHRK
jgi:hypothetical protein